MQPLPAHPLGEQPSFGQLCLAYAQAGFVLRRVPGSHRYAISRQLSPSKAVEFDDLCTVADIAACIRKVCAGEGKRPALHPWQVSSNHFENAVHHGDPVALRAKRQLLRSVASPAEVPPTYRSLEHWLHSLSVQRALQRQLPVPSSVYREYRA